jgi:hypothetical protein
MPSKKDVQAAFAAASAAEADKGTVRGGYVKALDARERATEVHIAYIKEHGTFRNPANRDA